jgi:hypothetical protein
MMDIDEIKREVPSSPPPPPPPKASRSGGVKVNKLPWIFGRLQSLHPPPGQQYRNSTLGRTLSESLDELIAAGKMTENLKESIMLHFDVHMAGHLSRCGVQAKFATGGLVAFKEVSGNYDIVMKGIEFSAMRRGAFNVNVEKV